MGLKKNVYTCSVKQTENQQQSMKATEFKSEIKKLKNQLKGITLQLINSNSAIPYNTLREFGNAVLNEESKGNSLAVSQVWTNEGTLPVTSLSQLAQLFLNKTITGIQFRTYSEQSQNATYNLGTLD